MTLGKSKFVVFCAGIFVFFGCNKKYSDEIVTSPNMSEESYEVINESENENVTIAEENFENEIYDYPETIIKYVSVDEGANLNYRESPVDGKKLGKFSNGTKLKITKRTNTTYTVEGVTDYWVYALSYADIEPYGGWVFGGFLSDNNPIDSGMDVKSLLVGHWDSPASVILIYSNGNIVIGLKESEGISGNWDLIGTDIISVTDVQTYDEEPYSLTMKIKSISNSKMIIEWESGFSDEYNKIDQP